MHFRSISLCLGAGFFLSVWSAVAGAVVADANAASALYAQHCARCHGAQRLGAIGPALLAQSLERLPPAEAQAVISKGHQATQMAAFAALLKPEEITQLVQWIYSPVQPPPQWSDADTRASRIETPGAAALPAQPLWRADPMNLFVVIEGGDHHVSLVDGDRFEPIHRFPSRFALHAGAKFSSNGRFVYFGSRDGWISKYDLWNLTLVAEVRAGLHMRNVAVSGDGRWVMAANYLPNTLSLFDADLNLVRSYSATSLDGKRTSRVAAVYDATPRHSFIVTLKDMPELWEISYERQAEPIYDGLVHDYKMGEGMAKPGFLEIRRTPLEEPLEDFFFDQSYRHAVGSTRSEGGKAVAAQVVNLDVRRRIASFPLSGTPHLGSGIAFAWKDTMVLASLNLKDAGVTVVDMKTWAVLKTIATPGPGFFMRSHENSGYAWVDSMMSPGGRDTLTIIDKRTLEPVAQVREPGRTLSHIEFTRDGRFALASLSEMDGALIVYDALTLKEVTRLPMRKPIGKYNVWNKISGAEGSSH